MSYYTRVLCEGCGNLLGWCDCEPTRVGSFDDAMYRAIYGEYINPLKRRKAELIHEALQRLEAEEQRIADSHDISKSNFGFNS